MSAVSPLLRGRTFAWGWRGAVAVLAVLGTLSIATGDPYYQQLFVLWAAYATLATALNLAAGFTGLFSLGHAGLFAIGAYVTAIAAAEWNTNVFLLIPVAILAAAAVGLLLGLLSLRFDGLYFAIVTLIFVFVMTVIVQRLSITGGAQGLLGPELPDAPAGLGGLGAPIAWMSLATVAAAAGIARAIAVSPLYPALVTIRDSEPAARVAGIPVTRLKVEIFTLSAGLAGLAGWLFSFSGFIGPTQFNWSASVTVLVMVVLGGMDTVLGPLLGAAFIVLFPNYVHISAQLQEILYGALFIAVVIVFPRGFVGWIDAIVARLRRLLAGSTGAAPAAGGGGGDEGVPAVRQGLDVVLTGIKFRYGQGPPVLDDVNITVKPGTIHGLIGPNGSGKSTLVNTLSGFLPPVAGTVQMGGRRLPKRGVGAGVKLGMRRSFQEVRLPASLSCMENCLVGCYTDFRALVVRAPLWPLLPRARREDRAARERSRAALAWAGISEWEERPTGDCPHAVQQLLQLAVAYLGRPALLILDEPVAGLTPNERGLVADRLRRLHELGVTVLLIEHHVGFIFSLCDSISVLDGGKVIAEGRPADIRVDPAVRSAYLGV